MVQVGSVPMTALVAPVAPVAPWELRMEPPLVELPLARPVDAWQASVDTLQEALGKVVERMVVFWWSSSFLLMPGKPSVPFFFRQLWLVLGVKLLEINSNWFSRWLFLVHFFICSFLF